MLQIFCILLIVQFFYLIGQFYSKKSLEFKPFKSSRSFTLTMPDRIWSADRCIGFNNIIIYFCQYLASSSSSLQVTALNLTNEYIAMNWSQQSKQNILYACRWSWWYEAFITYRQNKKNAKFWIFTHNSPHKKKKNKWLNRKPSSLTILNI